MNWKDNFTLKCNKCGSEDVDIVIGFDSSVQITCDDCENEFEGEM